MTKFNRKNGGEWIEGKLSQKRDDSYSATKISVRDSEWKGEINSVTFSVTVPTDTTLALTGLEANSFSGGKALRAVQISDNIETDLSVDGSTVTFTPGSYKVRIELRKNTIGVEQSVVFPFNSIVTSMDDVSGYRGPMFPNIRSSVLVSVPNSLPRTITSLASAFSGCSKFNQELNWDTSNVTNMNAMFQSCPTFNQPVNFDTSNVTNMGGMLNGCAAFNQPVNFDTSNVTNMSFMFNGCSKFNQPLNFDTSKVMNMGSMFSGCATFNQSVNFDTSNVMYMNFMFSSCTIFNQPVNFDTSKVTDMSFMFQGCAVFNQDVSTWDVANVASWDYFRGGSSLSDANTPPKFL